MKTTGESLTDYIYEHGFSKIWLSNATGISMTSISRICKNDRCGNLDTWMRFADAMHTTVSEIIGFEKEGDD